MYVKTNCRSYLTNGRVLSSSWQQTSRYFFTSAIYRDHASFGCSAVCSVFGFATTPVFKILPPLLLPTINGGGTTGFSSKTEVVGFCMVGCIRSCIFLNSSIKLPSFLKAFGCGTTAAVWCITISPCSSKASDS